MQRQIWPCPSQIRVLISNHTVLNWIPCICCFGLARTVLTSIKCCLIWERTSCSLCHNTALIESKPCFQGKGFNLLDILSSFRANIANVLLESWLLRWQRAGEQVILGRGKGPFHVARGSSSASLCSGLTKILLPLIQISWISTFQDLIFQKQQNTKRRNRPRSLQHSWQGYRWQRVVKLDAFKR